MFKEITGIRDRDLIVYVLCNYDTTIEQDLERIYTLRKMGYWAYVMLYDKEHIPKGHELRKLQRWVNNRFVFAKCETFEEYKCSETNVTSCDFYPLNVTDFVDKM
jgi:hypothetical protein